MEINKNIGRNVLAYAALFTVTVIAGVILSKYTSDKIEVETIAVDSGISATVTPDAPGMADGKVNINTADSETLQTVKGIGESTAKKIIEYREKNGGFKSIENIMDISGIGQKKFESFKDFICVR